MMQNISSKQLKANQVNALKGGVKTLKGKEKSRKNALKSGLYTRAFFLEGENDIFNEEISALAQIYNNNDYIVNEVIQMFAITRLRYLRGINMEMNLIKNLNKTFKVGGFSLSRASIIVRMQAEEKGEVLTPEEFKKRVNALYEQKNKELNGKKETNIEVSATDIDNITKIGNYIQQQENKILRYLEYLNSISK